MDGRGVGSDGDALPRQYSVPVLLRRGVVNHTSNNGSPERPQVPKLQLRRPTNAEYFFPSSHTRSGDNAELFSHGRDTCQLRGVAV